MEIISTNKTNFILKPGAAVYKNFKLKLRPNALEAYLSLSLGNDVKPHTVLYVYRAILEKDKTETSKFTPMPKILENLRRTPTASETFSTSKLNISWSNQNFFE